MLKLFAPVKPVKRGKAKSIPRGPSFSLQHDTPQAQPLEQPASPRHLREMIPREIQRERSQLPQDAPVFQKLQQDIDDLPGRVVPAEDSPGWQGEGVEAEGRSGKGGENGSDVFAVDKEEGEVSEVSGEGKD